MTGRAVADTHEASMEQVKKEWQAKGRSERIYGQKSAGRPLPNISSVAQPELEMQAEA